MKTSTRKARIAIPATVCTSTTRIKLTVVEGMTQAFDYELMRVKIWRTVGAAAASIDPKLWKDVSLTSFQYKVWDYDEVAFGAGSPAGLDVNDVNTFDHTDGTGCLYVQVTPDVDGDTFAGEIWLER